MQLFGGNPRGRGGRRGETPRPHRSPPPRPFLLHLRHREAEGPLPPLRRGGAPAGPHAPWAPRGRGRAPRSPPPRARVRAGALRPEPRRHRRALRAVVRELVIPEMARPVPFSAPAAIPRAWRTRRIAVPRLANPALFASAVFPVVDERSRFVCYIRGRDLLRVLRHQDGGLVEALAAAHLGAVRGILGQVRALAWLPHPVEPRAGVLGELLLHGDLVGEGRSGIAVAEQERDALQSRGAASIDVALLDRGVPEEPRDHLHPDLALGPGVPNLDDALGHLQPDALGLDDPHLDGEMEVAVAAQEDGDAAAADEPHIALGLDHPHLGVALGLDHPHPDGALDLAVAAQENGAAAAAAAAPPPQVGDGLDYERDQIDRLYRSLVGKRVRLEELARQYQGILQAAHNAALRRPDRRLLDANLAAIRAVLKGYEEVKKLIEPFRKDMERAGAAPPEPPVELARPPVELLPAVLRHRI